MHDKSSSACDFAVSVLPRAALIQKMSHLRLDRLRLSSLSHSVLSQLPVLTHLFLQHNRLTDISPVTFLPQLRLLAASYNLIEQVSVLLGGLVGWNLEIGIHTDDLQHLVRFHETFQITSNCLSMIAGCLLQPD